MSNGTAHNSRFATTPHASGWVTFASLMMIVAGFFQIIGGLVALFKPSLYIASANHLLVLNYHQWGWVHLIVGIILMASSASLMAGRLWGRVMAIFIATISAIVNFGFIWAYPIWSILIIAIDIMVIYAVAVYGGAGSGLTEA